MLCVVFHLQILMEDMLSALGTSLFSNFCHEKIGFVLWACVTYPHSHNEDITLDKIASTVKRH